MKAISVTTYLAIMECLAYDKHDRGKTDCLSGKNVMLFRCLVETNVDRLIKDQFIDMSNFCVYGLSQYLKMNHKAINKRIAFLSKVYQIFHCKQNSFGSFEMQIQY